MSAERKLNPSELTEEQVKLMAVAVAGELSKIGLLIDKPMTREQAADFTEYGVSRFDDLVRMGKFKAFRPFPNSDPRYLPSQLIEQMKNWK